MANYISAQEYLTKSETKLRLFEREWESFASEVPVKLMDLIRSGIRPSQSMYGSGNRISVTFSVESNTDAAKKYIEQAMEKMKKKGKEIEKQIMDIDNDLEGYVDEGVDSDLFTKLVKNLNDWISYIPKMSLQATPNSTVNLNISDEILAIKKKWDKVSAEEIRKKEAAKYGVALADLDKHKMYLDAKSQKAAAKTSAAMKKAEKAFASIKGYLDSADLEKACASYATELKAREDEEVRIKVEAYEKEVAEINKAKAEYISSETSKVEKKYSDALSKLKAEYETACRKNEDDAEKTASEKARFEKELEDAGLFAFGKKKQLRLDVEALAEKIRQLTNQKTKLDADYASAQQQEKNAYESSLKVIPMNADKKFVLPRDPRK